MTHVCLIAEGCYPFVTGGVGKWTHDLIASLPEIDFTILALWSSRKSMPPSRYPKLPNVREIRPIFLLDRSQAPRMSVPRKTWEDLETFHEGLKKGDVSALSGVCPHVSASAFLKDDRSWKLLCSLYETHGIPGMSFPDYFWTWRATHLPLFRVLESPLSDADVVHTISTGYAGCVAAVHKLRRGIPMITTEHGIYTRERAQEIWDADWIPGEDRADERRSSNAFKNWWNRMFEGMERITYATSDAVISLFEENRRYQVSRGAPEGRAWVIPNGVDLSLYDEVRTSRRSTGRFHIGLVGRIVPIKDIKTFIAACGILRDKLGGDLLEASLIGPSDEDELYASQCVEMVRLLGLEKVVHFLGKRDPREYYRTLDSLVLTSLSEGQPLVLLEGMSCGIPFVATDVGCCRELLEGRDAEDRKLGTAGLITRIAAPEETAAALFELAGNPDLRERMARSGRRRVETYYRLDQVRTAYLELYRGLTDGRR